MPKAQHNLATELDPESQKVIDWRYQWLCSAGYSRRNAEILALSRVDYRFAIDSLINARAKGFDEDYVMKLLL